MMDMITGWTAYALTAHSMQSILFFLFLTFLSVIFIRAQFKIDDFDIRDVICSYSNGRRAISTSKTLLAGTWLASSYYIMVHDDATAFTAYLAAWVLNGGITAWQKTKTKEKSEEKHNE